MSAHVDVLAVMDALRGFFEESASKDEPEAARLVLIRADEARAAVAELVEAAEELIDARPGEANWNRINAAVARVRGATP